MSFEWVLKTPVEREFDILSYYEEQYGEICVDEEGNPITKAATRQIPETVIERHRAHRVRLASMHNDKANERLFVRFFYGNVDEAGLWNPARLDDGMVVSGPDYHKIDLDLDGEIEPNEVLVMCAKLLHWDGELGTFEEPPVLQEG